MAAGAALRRHDLGVFYKIAGLLHPLGALVHEAERIEVEDILRVTDAGGGIAVAPLGTQAYNPAFDVTPPELVTAIVTEEGAVSPVTADALAELCDRSRQVTI